MNAEQFSYWIKGFFEISEAKTLDEKQVQIIKDHLAEVFNKVTPNRSAIEMKDLDKYLKEHSTGPALPHRPISDRLIC